ITQSLLKDGDLKIENNHVARDYSSFYGGTIAPDYLVKGRNGAIYSIHAPGVAALVLPAFALLGFRGAQATVILLFAIAGALMWRAAWRLTGDTSAAWFAWAGVAGSTTMAVLSFMIFPETPGACVVSAGVWLLVSHRDASNRAVVAVGAALAVLPWLHTRFSVLAGLLGVALLGMLLTDDARTMPARLRRAALFIVIPVVSAGAWLSMFYVVYGTFDPRAPYGPDPKLRSWIWSAVTGLFVDQQFGLMTYAPVLFVAFIASLMAAPRQWRSLSALCFGVVILYAMAVASYWMWWAGRPGLPARFLTAALPLLALPLAVVWARATVEARKVLLGLLMVSLAITVLVLCVNRAALIGNDRDGQAAWLEWLNQNVNLPRAWPSFFWNGEGSFLGHAAIFVAMVGLIGFAIRLLSRRYSTDPAAARAWIATSMLAGLMVIIQMGWTVTASAPLDSARAQLAVRAAAGAGAPVWQIGNGFRRWDADASPLRIQRDQPSLLDEAAGVMAMTNVPAGAYKLEITSGSLSGALAVRLRSKAPPFQRFDIASSQSQSFPLVLPAGVAVLLLEAESAELARQLQVTLIPVGHAIGRSGYARQNGRYGDVDVFFLDGNVFAEADGFWVRGGQTTDVVLSQGGGAANRAGTLTVRNGAAANTVTIRSGAWQEVLTLTAGETRVVALPASDALGAWPLTITSASGFRPSDTAGEDRRFLGVWISR
ncbi:MAG TPA: hypothetical protein VMZ90_06990, partial [Vicinamibacterales bacterium]|nr:hypothetical protein [Vicinamibacterales bacterium]